MAFILTFGSVGLAALLSVAGWLIKRNEDQHEQLGEKVDSLAVGQAEIKKDIEHLDKRFDRLDARFDKVA